MRVMGNNEEKERKKERKEERKEETENNNKNEHDEGRCLEEEIDGNGEWGSSSIRPVYGGKSECMVTSRTELSSDTPIFVLSFFLYDYYYYYYYYYHKILSGEILMITFLDSKAGVETRGVDCITTEPTDQDTVFHCRPRSQQPSLTWL